MTELGGLDAIAFTGGIGENSALLRKMIVEGLHFLGAKLDENANDNCAGEARISADDSEIEVFVIPANEEFMVVNETYAKCIKCK